VTIDDAWSVDATVESLRALPVRPTARVVFDVTISAAEYRGPVAAIHEVSDVMGELVDSQFVANLDAEAYARRAEEYMDALGSSVNTWEIGNEVNGEWLGATRDVVAKMSAGYAAARGRCSPTALTLYYNDGCWADADHEMFAWAEANVPAAMRQGLDYVLVSYYEDDCGGVRPDWPAVFRRLAGMFPSAALGFGECGTSRPSAKPGYLSRYYGMRLSEERFVGGFFWWDFSSDMVPRSKPLWGVLHRLMAAR